MKCFVYLSLCRINNNESPTLRRPSFVNFSHIFPSECMFFPNYFVPLHSIKIKTIQS